MPTSRDRRAPLALAALFASACSHGTVPATLPPEVASECGTYVDVGPDAFALCVSRVTRRLHDTTAMAAACDTLPDPASGACRMDWVMARRSEGQPASSLVEACGKNADCAFLMLDQDPAQDVLQQVKLCHTYTGDFAASCVGHAGARWAKGNAWEGERERVVGQLDDKDAYIMGVQWGLVRGPGSCPADSTRFSDACHLAVEGRAGPSVAPSAGDGIPRAPGG